MTLRRRRRGLRDGRGSGEEDGGTRPPARMELATELVVRASTGPASAGGASDASFVPPHASGAS